MDPFLTVNDTNDFPEKETALHKPYLVQANKNSGRAVEMRLKLGTVNDPSC